MNLNQVTLPARDMTVATAFYRKIGFLQIVDTPHYARFSCPEGDSTFSLSLTSEVSNNGAVIYFEHQALDDLVELLEAKGIVFEHGAEDKRYLWREAMVYDPCGNKVIFYWAGDNRHNPPWRVERTD